MKVTPRHRKVTLKSLSRAWMGLQEVHFKLPYRYRDKVAFAMVQIDETRAAMRHKAIFEAGARARKPVPKFDGEPLGSSEAVTYYDGHASTHPKFKNPYRQRH